MVKSSIDGEYSIPNWWLTIQPHQRVLSLQIWPWQPSSSNLWLRRWFRSPDKAPIPSFLSDAKWIWYLKIGNSQRKLPSEEEKWWKPMGLGCLRCLPIFSEQNGTFWAWKTLARDISVSKFCTPAFIRVCLKLTPKFNYSSWLLIFKNCMAINIAVIRSDKKKLCSKQISSALGEVVVLAVQVFDFRFHLFQRSCESWVERKNAVPKNG